MQRRPQMLWQLGRAAERPQRDDRTELAIPIGQRGLCVEVAVDEGHDVASEVAQPLDGAQGLLVVHLEEPGPSPRVALIHPTTVTEGHAPSRDLRRRRDPGDGTILRARSREGRWKPRSRSWADG